MGNRGKREFIQALRLMEVFPEPVVAAAAMDAFRIGAVSGKASPEHAIREQFAKPTRAANAERLPEQLEAWRTAVYPLKRAQCSPIIRQAIS
jgi:hypothetical protein